MLTLFIQVTEETIINHRMDGFDHSITELIRYFANPTLDTIMIYITNLGSAKFYGLLVPIILFILTFYRRRREAYSLSICLVGAGILNFLLKHLFERARPDLLHIVEASGYSFPSGHAMLALCIYGMIAYLVSRTIPHWHWRFALFCFTSLIISLVGISRIYLGVHYPSDVLGAYTAGATWLTFCISLLILWEKYRS